ncbi:MAG: hypothetical protein Q9157_001453 [Trypethelium eluteriae]
MSDAAQVRGPRTLNDFLFKYLPVQYVRLHWQDFSGVVRTRLIPKWRALDIAQGSESYTLAQDCMIMPVSTAPEAFPDRPQRWELHPDWEFIRLCGFNPIHAAVMCFVAHRDIEQRYAKCPRSLLNSKLTELNNLHGERLLIGFEIEFVLLDETMQLAKPFEPIGNYSVTAGLRGEYLTIIEEILDALEASSIKVYDFHGEVADQLEITTAPLPPIEAIDALLFAQETIRTVFVRHRLKASMYTEPAIHGPQNGCHMHLSITPKTSADPFLAGIMENMKSLCAFGMPNVDSYARVCVADDGAGLRIGWGTKNRDLPVRRIADARWEIRFLDCIANLYLFVAAVAAAGLNGIRSQKMLKWRDADCFLNKFSAEEREAKFGITQDMPHSLRETLDSLRENNSIREWIGEALTEQYTAVKEIEIKEFRKITDEERRLKFLGFF